MITSALSLFLLPTAYALTILTPTNWTSNGFVALSWNHESTDPTFAFRLLDTQLHNSSAFGDTMDAARFTNNVTAQDSCAQLGPVPPKSGYEVQAVSPPGSENVIASSSDFTIAPSANPPSTTCSPVTRPLPTPSSPSPPPSGTTVAPAATSKPLSGDAASIGSNSIRAALLVGILTVGVLLL